MVGSLRHRGRFYFERPGVLAMVFLQLQVAIGVTLGDSVADGVLLHGAIVTMDSTQPQAMALAWADGRIVAVGSDAEIGTMVGPHTAVIDLRGRLAIPGFIESHGHFSSTGFARMQLELRDDPSWRAIVVRVAEAARTTPRGQWITGRGWHQEKWSESLAADVEGYPLHDALSAVTPDHPVVLTHASGHLAIANARALQLAGIDEHTADPEGGMILRDEQGRVTGVLRETAMERVTRLSDRAADSPTMWKQAIKLAAEECLINGITSFQDAGSSFDEIDRYRQAAAAGELPIRLWVMVRDETPKLQRLLSQYRMINADDEFLTVRAIKMAIDGALGSHGAWLLEPYEDLPSSTGLNTTPLDELEIVARLAVNHEMQLCVHAIGDRANREVLDLYERIFREFPSDHSYRWRIEHAQHLDPADASRFGPLGVIAAMQAVHCTSDAPFVTPRLGMRRAATGAYRWRDLLASGAVICNGTDTPVEHMDPIASFYASVTRKTKDGLAFIPEQSMTREEALRSYTTSAAFAAFEETQKGSLTVGKLADIVVLSKNIMTCDEEQIPTAQVDLTMVGGQVCYQRSPTDEP